jgi:hypothetical protein
MTWPQCQKEKAQPKMTGLLLRIAWKGDNAL